MESDRAKLHASWDATARDLAAARALLPAVASGGDGATVESFERFLERNELALALDELAGVGMANNAPVAFWKLLKSAAVRMSLPDQTEIDQYLGDA